MLDRPSRVRWYASRPPRLSRLPARGVVCVVASSTMSTLRRRVEGRVVALEAAAEDGIGVQRGAIPCGDGRILSAELVNKLGERGAADPAA